MNSNATKSLKRFVVLVLLLVLPEANHASFTISLHDEEGANNSVGDPDEQESRRHINMLDFEQDSDGEQDRDLMRGMDGGTGGGNRGGGGIIQLPTGDKKKKDDDDDDDDDKDKKNKRGACCYNDLDFPLFGGAINVKVQCVRLSSKKLCKSKRSGTFYEGENCKTACLGPTPSPATHMPTFDGTHMPTFDGTHMPTFDGTHMPTFDGTHMPTFLTGADADMPSELPSSQPSELPSSQPSELPSGSPSQSPSEGPTPGPTPEPTPSPTDEDKITTIPCDSDNHPIRDRPDSRFKIYKCRRNERKGIRLCLCRGGATPVWETR